MRMLTRSVTEFSLHDTPSAHASMGQLQVLPYIWVDRKELYQYQTQEYGERRRYVLRDEKLLDPYRYIEDKTAAMATVLVPTWS